MNREDLSWILIVIVLLVASYLIGRQFPAAEGDTGLTSTPSAERSFRVWLWEARRLDVAAQVGLIFVGALGIAALLPRSGEEPPK